MTVKIGLQIVAKCGGPEFNETVDLDGNVFAISRKAKGQEIASLSFACESDLQLFFLLAEDLVTRDWPNHTISGISLAENGIEGSRLYIDGLDHSSKKLIFTREQITSKQMRATLVE